MISTDFFVAFDGDDTLWPNEINYRHLMDEVKNILKPCDVTFENCFEKIMAAKLKSNIQILGYGMKTYIMTLIGTIIDNYENVDISLVSDVLKLGEEYVARNVTPFKHAGFILDRISKKYPLLLITKGDLFEQCHKIESSGLRHYFDGVYCLCEKTESAYAGILDTYNIDAKQFLMIGNSYQSDILPVVGLGGNAIYVGGELNMDLESIPTPEELLRHNVRKINDIQDITLELIKHYDNG